MFSKKPPGDPKLPFWDGEDVTLSRVKWPPSGESKGHFEIFESPDTRCFCWLTDLSIHEARLHHASWLAKMTKRCSTFWSRMFHEPICARVDPLPYIGDGLPTSNRGTLYTLTIGWITIPYEAYNGEFGPHILLCWNRTPLPCLDVSAPPRHHQCWPHQFHSQSLPTSVVNASMLLAKWNNISPTFGFSWNSRKFPLLNHHHFGVAQKPRVWGRDLIIWLEMVGWCHWFRDYAA